jgi:hypothetical protein
VPGAGHEDLVPAQHLADAEAAVRAALGRLSGSRVSLRKSVLCGAFVWARGALNDQKRRVAPGQYPSREDTPVLRGLDLEVAPGQVLWPSCWAV